MHVLRKELLRWVEWEVNLLIAKFLPAALAEANIMELDIGVQR